MLKFVTGNATGIKQTNKHTNTHNKHAEKNNVILNVKHVNRILRGLWMECNDKFVRFMNQFLDVVETFQTIYL